MAPGESSAGDLEFVEGRLREILARICGCALDAFAASDPLFRGGLELDSQSAARLIETVEREFRIRIADEDLDLASLQSLDSLAHFVAARAGTRASPHQPGAV